MIALLGTAFASTHWIDVQICVSYDVDYVHADDPGGTYNFAVGDYWTDNSVHQPARYQLIETRHTASGGDRGHYLNSFGCAVVDFLVPVGEPAKFELVVHNTAKVGNVDVELRTGPKNGSWSTGSSMSQTVTSVSAPAGGTADVVIDAVDGWQFMPIVTWMLYRQDWRLDEPNGRNCCLESGTMNADGTCAGASPEPYERNADPYLETAPLLALYAYNDSGSCCGSKFRWSMASGDEETTLAAGATAQWRMSLSHEVGHMLAGIRMGKWESGQYGLNPPMDGCAGDAGIPVGDRGILTKEFLARAMREGWAEYVKAWTWNAPDNPNPAVVSFNLLDMDLDGDLDNDWPGNHPYDKSYVLGAGVEIGQSDPGDPTAGWLVGLDTNWLGTAMDKGACNTIDPLNYACPAAAPQMESWNRSTVFDVGHMFWDLQSAYTPDELLDLYIDTCPRGWREGDGNCSTDDDLPYMRLLHSASEHGMLGDVGAALQDHVEY